jgi:hypothetical protein
MGYQSNYASRNFSTGTIALIKARQSDADGIVRCANPKCAAALIRRAPDADGEMVETILQLFIADHIVPWWVKRHSGPSNGQLLCDPCNKAKTGGEDIPAISRIKRIIRKRRARHPMPCGRDSKWSKPVGSFFPVRRTSQADKLAATLERRHGPFTAQESQP